MKTKLYSAALLAAAASMVLAQEAVPAAQEPDETSVEASIDIASAMIYNDGSILSDSAVLQPALTVSTKVGPLPLAFGVFANYDLADGKKNSATQKHAFTEIDLSVGTTYDFGFAESTLSLYSWQYPNMAGWNGEEILAVGFSREFKGEMNHAFKLGANFEYTLTGDSEGGFDAYPHVGYSRAVRKFDLSLTATACYMLQDGGAVDAWTAYVLEARATYDAFSAYVSYYGQISDKIYTDEIHDQRNVVFGLGYKVAL